MRTSLLHVLVWISSLWVFAPSSVTDGFAGLASRSTSAAAAARSSSGKVRQVLLRMSSSTDAVSSQETSATDEVTSSTTTATTTAASPKLMYHHTAFRIRNITTAINFYSLLGFEVEHKFLLDERYKGAWLKSGDNLRIELLEAKSWLLDEPAGKKRRALDLMALEELLGLNHFAMDVTHLMNKNETDTTTTTTSTNHTTTTATLRSFISGMNATSIERFGRTIRIAVEPLYRIIGKDRYEIAFLYDCDGALLELIRKTNDTVDPELESTWDKMPWKTFLKLMASGKKKKTKKVLNKSTKQTADTTAASVDKVPKDESTSTTEEDGNSAE